MELKFPGESLLIRLIETLEKSVGGLAKPWQIRREGQANAEARSRERAILFKTEMELEEVTRGNKMIDAKGNIVQAPATTPLLVGPRGIPGSAHSTSTPEVLPALKAQASSDAQAVEVREGINLKRIALLAEEEAERRDAAEGTNDARATWAGDEPKKARASRRPADDWVLRWRREAKGISDADLQRYWSRLLVGEVGDPGSFSLRTIDILSRMTKEDAQLIAKLAPFVWGSTLYVGPEEQGTHQLPGMNYDTLLYLQELGVLGELNGFGGPEWQLPLMTLAGEEVCLFGNDEFGLIAYPNPGVTKLAFPIHSVTKAGREIVSLTGIAPDPEWLRVIGRGLKTSCAKVLVGPRGTKTITQRQLAQHTEI